MGEVEGEAEAGCVMNLRSLMKAMSGLLLFAAAMTGSAQITVSIAPEDNTRPAPRRATSGSTAQASDSRIHREILQTYNFQPHLLASKQINEHSAILDSFWSKAKTWRAEYVPALRTELANFRNPAFFLYDGSMLLLSLSDTSSDRKIALAAISRCDLRDVQAKDYFRQVHRMAVLNEDTTDAAFRFLENPKFTVIIPQHALTLGQNYSLVYLLLPTNQEYWLQPAIDRLKSEQDITAQKSLLLLLWYAQTPVADDALASFSTDASRPAAARTYATELIRRKDQLPAEFRSKAAASTEAELRQKRRERMKAISDEALIDLDEYTAMLIAKRQ